MRKVGSMLLPSVGLEFSTNDVILLNDAQNFSIFRWRSSYISRPGMIVMPSSFEYGSPIACSLTMGQLKVTQLFDKLLIFMEPEGSLQYSQQLASRLYPNPDKANVHPQTLSPYANIYFMSPSIYRSPTYLLFSSPTTVSMRKKSNGSNPPYLPSVVTLSLSFISAHIVCTFCW